MPQKLVEISCVGKSIPRKEADKSVRERFDDGWVERIVPLQIFALGRDPEGLCIIADNRPLTRRERSAVHEDRGLHVFGGDPGDGAFRSGAGVCEVDQNPFIMLAGDLCQRMAAVEERDQDVIRFLHLTTPSQP